MSFYAIPPSLKAEIDELENLIGQFQRGSLDPVSFKARRVPFGIYEQRVDNTYMVRIRCPGGAITPLQLREVAKLSQARAADSVHITTRQELQLHDVALENVIPILRKLHELGLSTRGGGGNTVRNITASADSGTAKDEAFDVGPYAFALTSRLIAESDSWLLPRKYKIAFSNSANDSARAIFNDLGFIAIVKDGKKGFAVYVAGGLGSKPQVGRLLHEFVPDTEVYFIAEAVKRLFDKYGNRKNRNAARIRFLWNALGESQFRDLYQQALDDLRRQNAEPLVLPTPPDRQQPAGKRPDAAGSAEFQAWRRRFVAQQKQPGLHTALIPIALGNIAHSHLIALADYLIPLGDDVLRATIEQNLLLRNIPEDLLPGLFEIVKHITPLALEPKLLGSAVACTGAATCKLGVCLPRGALDVVIYRLRKSKLDLDKLSELRINISGCPNSCGAHATADLGFFGRAGRSGQALYPAYEVVAGAKLGHRESRLAESLGTVAARDLPAFIAEVLDKYLASLPSSGRFADYFDAQGKQDIESLCKKHQNVPSFDEDKNYYYDWGSSEVFSLAGRGVAECSAGLFDLIEVDLNRLRELRREFEHVPPADVPPEAIYETALLAARMLLITRGVEADSETAVFDLFARHFIAPGLVEAKYLPLIAAAKEQDHARLRELAADALGLAQTMEDLYAKMDNSLKFPGETSAARQAAKTPPDVVETKDFRGVSCPMNFVKTKLALESISAGAKLKVLLDDGAAIRNVPRSVADEGHKIVEQTNVGSHWEVVIEKRHRSC